MSGNSQTRSISSSEDLESSSSTSTLEVYDFKPPLPLDSNSPLPHDFKSPLPHGASRSSADFELASKNKSLTLTPKSELQINTVLNHSTSMEDCTVSQTKNQKPNNMSLRSAGKIFFLESINLAY